MISQFCSDQSELRLLVQLKKGHYTRLLEAETEGGQRLFKPVPVCVFWMSGALSQLLSCLSSL